MGERGQTTYDFAIGISVFLLVLIGVLTFLPSVFASYDTPVGADERAEADRVAGALVYEHQVAGSERTLLLNGTDGLASTIRGDTEFQSVRDGAGVPGHRRVSVEVVDGGKPSGVVDNGSGPVLTDREYDDQPAASTVRVVRFADSNACKPLCRIVVRVW